MKWLTKSDYLKFLTHPAYLWLQKHDKDKLPPVSEATQAIMDAGFEVESYARQLFANGAAVTSLFEDGVRKTDKLAKSGQPVIFQAAALTDRCLYAKADVLTKNKDDTWDLHEIKSSTKEKPEHAADLAFQKNTFEISGYPIKRTHLIHINRQYVRSGPVDPSKLFISLDITDKVEAIMNRTRRQIELAFDVMALPECPDDSPAKGNSWYGWRKVYTHLHPELRAGSIFNLCRLDLPQIRQLAKLGVTEMLDIPHAFTLKPPQAAQLAALKAGQPVIHALKIQHHLRKLRFPLYFFDYETAGGAIPAYDGMRPYQQVPFQYSLHILKEQGGEVEHREFLATGPSNPSEALLSQMKRDIDESGSVVVWYKDFEGGINASMARLYPEYRDFLRGINRRLYDLMEIFSNGYYNDAAFGGSASIKNVLPVLVPDMNHKDLEIKEGGTASLRWQQAAFDKIEPEKASKVYDDLRAYCRQDTLAMVRIYEFLMELQQTAPGMQLSLLG